MTSVRTITRRLGWFHLAMARHWVAGVRAIVTTEPARVEQIPVITPRTEHGCWNARQRSVQ